MCLLEKRLVCELDSGSCEFKTRRRCGLGRMRHRPRTPAFNVGAGGALVSFKNGLLFRTDVQLSKRLHHPTLRRGVTGDGGPDVIEVGLYFARTGPGACANMVYQGVVDAQI